MQRQSWRTQPNPVSCRGRRRSGSDRIPLECSVVVFPTGAQYEIRSEDCSRDHGVGCHPAKRADRRPRHRPRLSSSQVLPAAAADSSLCRGRTASGMVAMSSRESRSSWR